jgi:AraC family transcriptional regulator of adaptative response / DNA-3-methyladenine glycosylase II
MIERAEPWAPWRAYAAMHLWHRDDAFHPEPADAPVALAS